jgi:hypothetical protein
MARCRKTDHSVMPSLDLGRHLITERLILRTWLPRCGTMLKRPGAPSVWTWTVTSRCGNFRPDPTLQFALVLLAVDVGVSPDVQHAG